MRKCHYCGVTDKEMRPYGPGGSNVCFPCATETPEREAEMRERVKRNINDLFWVAGIVWGLITWWRKP